MAILYVWDYFAKESFINNFRFDIKNLMISYILIIYFETYFCCVTTWISFVAVTSVTKSVCFTRSDVHLYNWRFSRRWNPC